MWCVVSLHYKTAGGIVDANCQAALRKLGIGLSTRHILYLAVYKLLYHPHWYGMVTSREDSEFRQSILRTASF